MTEGEMEDEGEKQGGRGVHAQARMARLLGARLPERQDKNIASRRLTLYRFAPAGGRCLPGHEGNANSRALSK